MRSFMTSVGPAAVASREGAGSSSSSSSSSPSGDLASFLADLPADTARRARQEAAWAGTEVDARQLLFEREAARRHAALLADSIEAFWRLATATHEARVEEPPCSRLAALTPEILAAVAEWAEGRGAADVVARLGNSTIEAIEKKGREETRSSWRGVRVYARVRPPVADDATGHVAAAEPWRAAIGGPLATPAAVLHDSRLTRSGRFLRTTHHLFALDGVFDAASTGEAVTDRVMAPLLRTFFDAGRDATLLLFGQTGTGKTHTLRDALRAVARRLDEHFVPSNDGSMSSSLELTFVELRGNAGAAGAACADLLDPSARVKLLSDEKDEARFVGATTVPIRDAATLRDTVRRALDRRRSETTERNAESSRSHAIVEVRPAGARNALRLVDLAGSERKWETMDMRSRDAHRESAAINLSLMALKDCFRAQHTLATTTTPKAAHRAEDAAGGGGGGGGEKGAAKEAPFSTMTTTTTRVPFRASPLTRVLRRCFESAEPDATAIVATLSPAIEDLIHSVHTLRHVALMSPTLADRAVAVATERVVLPQSDAPRALAPVEAWTPAELRAWLLTAESGRFAHVFLPPNATAAKILAASAVGLEDLFADQTRDARTSHEGAMWVVAAAAASEQAIGNSNPNAANNNIGRALQAALRRESFKLRDLPSGR